MTSSVLILELRGLSIQNICKLHNILSWLLEAGILGLAFVVRAIASARTRRHSLSQMLSRCFTIWIQQIAICHETTDELGAMLGDRWRRYRWRTSVANLH